MPAHLRGSHERLSSALSANPIGVDRGRNVLKGMVVAMKGDFKSPGRGTFDMTSLKAIVDMGNASRVGLRSRWTHPSMCTDGLGHHLGRVKNFFMGVATRYDGEKVPAVRGDLHFDPTALREPVGGGMARGTYIMDLAENDPDALSSSLVMDTNKERQLDAQGRPRVDENGEELPPIWRPRRLFASDIVDTGDAVDGILSSGDALSNLGGFASLFTGGTSLDAIDDLNLPDATRAGAAMIAKLWPALSRAQVAERLCGWLDRCLDERFGPEHTAAAAQADYEAYRRERRRVL